MSESITNQESVEEVRANAIADDQSVLPRDPRVSATFGQPRWDLSAADHHDGRALSTTTVDWSEVDRDHPGWSQCLRELCYHRLNTRLPSLRTVGVYHAVREQLRAKAFLRWLKRQTNVTGPRSLTQQHVEQFRRFVEGHSPEDRIATKGGNNRREEAGAHPSTVWSYLGVIASLDQYRDHLSEPLSFRPYGGNLTPAFVGVEINTEENETEPLPAEVLGPLISTAVRYVEHYAAQIKQMSEERLAFWATTQPGSVAPPWRTTFEDCPVLGRPWAPPLNERGRPSHHVFRKEMSHFIAACMVIILYLSGMRPGEGCNLVASCRKPTVDPATGLKNRCKLVGKPLKKRGSRLTVDVEWVVPELVEKAVGLLVDLLEPYRTMHKTPLLVLSRDGLRSAESRTPGRAEKGGTKRKSKQGYPLGTITLNDMVKAFYGRVREHHPEAPEYDVMPSQFRRTLARFIAREPGGIIAGKLQYHHVSTAVFEGYAGSHDDGFILDVEDERVLMGIDILEEMLADPRAKHSPPVTRLLDEWEAVREQILFEGVIDTSADGAVVNARVRRIAGNIHVGALTYCAFNADTAMCLTQAEKEQAKPVPNISACSPDRCGNASIRGCHVPRWQALLDEVNHQKAKARSGPQRTSLAEAAKRYEGVIRRASA